MALVKTRGINRLRMVLREMRTEYVTKGCKGKPDKELLAQFDKELRNLDGTARLHPID